MDGIKNFEGILFDLDQTLVDSKKALSLRKKGKWKQVYQIIPTFEIYEGIDAALSTLQNRNINMGIVTSSPSYYAKLVLDHFSIEYDTLTAYHDTKRNKPHPEPILKGVSSLNLDVIQCLSIGDTISDATASKKAGVRFISALWDCEPNEKDELISLSDFSCETPSELNNLLQKYFS